MLHITAERTRRLLWFIGLYIGGIVGVGLAAFLLKALLGQA
ncbi:DUF2474 domain-containing protein [Thalassospira povalilytica]|uniref:DUF2474 domain-containing protein n=1 Tax=Thalassospira povalilytica TaxID=732237 RepID=A0ABX4R5S9_9PROT|nr:DUF2474 domain-containing protein [Thalassospira povalilytica]PKR48343.1 DUF2474 domain-containing protein [Thalassospira povalilytica]